MFPAMDDRSVPQLDDVTADRLLEGGVAPDDAPPGYQDVARALHAAALTASAPSTGDEATAVAAFLDAIPARRTSRMKKWKIAAATLAGGLALSTGLAAADVLPGPAQNVASSALSRVGINVPDGGDDSTTVSTKKAAKVDKSEDESSPTTHPDNHGSVVSDVARDDSNVGADHGAAVCTTASDGKCKAGETHGRSGAAGTQGNSGGTSSSSSNSGSSADTGSSNSSNTGSSNSSGTSSGGSSNSSSSSNSSGGSSSSSGSTSGG